MRSKILSEWDPQFCQLQLFENASCTAIILPTRLITRSNSSNMASLSGGTDPRYSDGLNSTWGLTRTLTVFSFWLIAFVRSTASSMASTTRLSKLALPHFTGSNFWVGIVFSQSVTSDKDTDLQIKELLICRFSEEHILKNISMVKSTTKTWNWGSEINASQQQFSQSLSVFTWKAFEEIKWSDT